jgi:hypothetical protein
MRWFAFIATLLLAASAPADAPRAAGGVECVKTQCEGKSRSCVEAIYAAHGACMKAGNTKCDAVPPAEKFNCLRSELAPCASTRNKEQDACLAEFHSCYRTCGPLAGRRADYWCVGEWGRTATAAFCVGDPASSKPADQCEKAFSVERPSEVSMTCYSL